MEHGTGRRPKMGLCGSFALPGPTAGLYSEGRVPRGPISYPSVFNPCFIRGAIQTFLARTSELGAWGCACVKPGLHRTPRFLPLLHGMEERAGERRCVFIGF